MPTGEPVTEHYDEATRALIVRLQQDETVSRALDIMRDAVVAYLNETGTRSGQPLDSAEIEHIRWIMTLGIGTLIEGARAMHGLKSAGGGQ